MQNAEKKIVKLPDNLSSLIAAGEVVVRPSSVIKELVENAVDGGANLIEVWIENGGKSAIIVKDNGNGMSYEDLKICTHKHTTSKISNNLIDINTFGFRGEALCSIAAVSRLKIFSRQKNTNESYGLYCNYEDTQVIESVICDEGTKIEVRDLFFSLPARLKFLKSDKVESDYCLSVIKKMSLVYPQISFSCYVDQKNVFQSKATKYNNTKEQFTNRAADILGSNNINNCLFIEKKVGAISLFGFVSKPLNYRSSRDMQIFFVNNRPVKDVLFHASLRIAYADVIPSNKHPIAVLFVKLDNYLIDVNVHPAKTEIHFRDPYSLRNVITSAISDAIKSSDLDFNRTMDFNPSMLNKFNRINQGHDKYIADYTSNQSNKDITGKILHKNHTDRKHDQPCYTLQEESKKTLFDTLPSLDTNSTYLEEEKDIDNQLFPLGHAVAQINKTFIFSISKNAVFFVDQHAAHERIRYEDVKKKLDQNKFLLTQKLIIPVEIEFANVEEYQVFVDNKEQLLKVGLNYQLLQNNKISVTDIPSFISDVDIDDLIRHICQDYLNMHDVQSITDKVDYFLKTFSCHRSIRANKKLSIENMNDILRQIERDKTAMQCNHGRPTYIKFSFDQIAKWFDRT